MGPIVGLLRGGKRLSADKSDGLDVRVETVGWLPGSGPGEIVEKLGR
jgi:hypothetical protein